MRKLRRASGNMMAMMISTFIVMAALICFGLWYTQHSLTTTEHRTSIDSAALAAAASVSRIVVLSKDVGWVSLTGNAPIGTNMKAPDNWFMRVHSINELMATNRVDYIIACELNDNFLKALAMDDHAKILSAKDDLNAAISAAIAPGGSGKDIDGNDVKPYDDALQLYLSNPTLASTFVPGSFKLEVGSVQNGVTTAVRVPNPVAKASLGAGDMIDNKYRSDRNIAYNGVAFVFAPVGDQVALASHVKFTTNTPGLPFQMPAAIQVTAQQKFEEQGKVSVVPYSSVATPGGVFTSPADGQFRISFPDGRPTEINKIRDVFNWNQMNKKASVYTAEGGDYPTAGGSSLDPTLPWNPLPWSSPPKCEEVAKVCFWDWLRNAGSKVNIDSVVGAVDMPFNDVVPPFELWATKDSVGKLIGIDNVPVGNLHEFDFNRSGDVHYVWKRVIPEPYYPVGNKQLYAECVDLTSASPAWIDPLTGLPLPILDNGVAANLVSLNKFDVYFRDFVRTRGGGVDGLHVGEPLALKPDHGTAGSACGGGYLPMGTGNGLPPAISEQTDFAISTDKKWPVRYKNYTPGPAGGAPRPTFSIDGVCSEIRYRRQLEFTPVAGGPKTTGYKGTTLAPDTPGVTVLVGNPGKKVPPRGGKGSGGRGSNNGIGLGIGGGRGGGRGGGGSGGSGGGGSGGGGRGGGGDGGS